MISEEQLAQNIQKVEERIEAALIASARQRDELRVIAVSKKQSATAVQALAMHGYRDFGENYIQEAIEKMEQVETAGGELRWHCIGHVQSNKAKFLDRFSWFHCCDSINLIRKIDRFVWPRPLNVLIQVNIGNESSKSGVSEEALPQLIEACQASEKVNVGGLMVIPPYCELPEEVRPIFAKARALVERHNLTELSMGMSHDFEIAIAEGATMIRVGSALFGPRP